MPSLRRWPVLIGFFFVLFCFLLGVLLLVFPWTEYWELNYFATASPALQNIWMNSYFRGAISGLGLVNIFVSFVEVISLRRLLDWDS